MSAAARHTKIVCTIGPASSDDAAIARLIAAGMNVARINMSHGTRDAHAGVLKRVRSAADATGRAVAVMQDLQGPKIRIGMLEGGSVQLVSGAEVAITTSPIVGNAGLLSTPHLSLPEEVRAGDPILLADGLIELRVELVSAQGVRCRVVNGGRLLDRQGINLPRSEVSAPSLTDKDLDDLRWGIEQGVDYVAVSFVRRPEDVETAKAQIRRAGVDTPVIAKLEKPQALQRLDAILDAADGVMVARGDMGVELPPEDVPVWQKRIIAAARALHKPVITATQMLESMVRNPRPTRAEVTDVANAIWDGTDAVMLSAETAVGDFPVEAVAMMDRIARAAERERRYMQLQDTISGRPDFPHVVGLAARAIDDALPDAVAIVAFTRDGATARLMSSDRPASPLLGLTDDPAVYRRLALHWGVTPFLSDAGHELPDLLREAERAVQSCGVGGPGDAVLVVGHLPAEAPGSTNFVTLHRIP